MYTCVSFVINAAHFVLKFVFVGWWSARRRLSGRAGAGCRSLPCIGWGVMFVLIASSYKESVQYGRLTPSLKLKIQTCLPGYRSFLQFQLFIVSPPLNSVCVFIYRFVLHYQAHADTRPAKEDETRDTISDQDKAADKGNIKATWGIIRPVHILSIEHPLCRAL